MTAPNPVTCARCGASVAGRFCTECGAEASGGSCAQCEARLSPGAKFCHRCGAPAAGGRSPRSDRFAWTIALVAVLVTVGVVAYEIGRGRVSQPTVAEMGNAGNSGGAAGPAVRAPDISKMTPRERFDRLWERVMRAAEQQSADTVTMFAPMALMAYRQLDSVDTDARLHVAMIHVAVGELKEAKALADTIAAQSPSHLFAPLIRGSVAEQENDTKSLKQAYADFLAHYDAETKANRKEYTDHRPILDDFRTRAMANAK